MCGSEASKDTPLLHLWQMCHEDGPPLSLGGQLRRCQDPQVLLEFPLLRLHWFRLSFYVPNPFNNSRPLAIRPVLYDCSCHQPSILLCDFDTSRNAHFHAFAELHHIGNGCSHREKPIHSGLDEEKLGTHFRTRLAHLVFPHRACRRL